VETSGCAWGPLSTSSNVAVSVTMMSNYRTASTAIRSF
jgi:hypothetical protein